MKRLIESPASDDLNARAQLLVRAMGSTPESAERQERVRRALLARHAQRAPAWGTRLALGSMFLAASAAAAAAATGVFASATEPPAPLPPPSFAPAPSPGAGTVPPRRSAPAEPPTAVPAVEATHDSLPSPPPVTTERPASTPSTAAAASDVARVHEAAKALRRDGDPARALALLEGSRVTGPLAEESLALRIEAALASGNGRAAKLAGTYLARYPSGRYRELAQKALAGHQP